METTAEPPGRAEEMGTLFKALAIVPKHVPVPPGF